MNLKELIRSAQPALEAYLYKLLLQPASPSAPAPRIGRPARSLISRCLILLYTSGDTKSLFDGMQALQRAMGDVKVDKEQRVSAFYAAGEIMQALGSQVKPGLS